MKCDEIFLSISLHTQREEAVPGMQRVADDQRVIVHFIDFGERAFCTFDDVRATNLFGDVPAKAHTGELAGMTVVSSCARNSSYYFVPFFFSFYLFSQDWW
jgi:hypothetical protein